MVIRPAYVPKGRPSKYFSKSRRGLGYASSSSELCCNISEDSGGARSDDQSSTSSAWDSDVSVGDLFKDLIVNMATTDPTKIMEDEQVPLYDEAWDHRVSAQWNGRFEQRKPPTKDKILQINMGNEANLKPIFISDSLPSWEKENLISLIREYIDVFALNYEDMPGLDPRIAMQRLNISPDAKPVKQQQRRFHPQIMEAIESEVKKLIKSGFIREEQHPDWVANIVSVLKKNDKIRICIDFRDLNTACPKDEFPLPITDVIIDNTCEFERMSFMDGFLGYNQIKMYPPNHTCCFPDEPHTGLHDTTRCLKLVPG
uniref:Gag/pol polyprotein, related n=1 Tax=Asparagus officinalis TaxID=4686 RepID=Q2AA16_ASPOF|nr:gag/pol polyprotein, related [Asparagus officinalis]